MVGQKAADLLNALHLNLVDRVKAITQADIRQSYMRNALEYLSEVGRMCDAGAGDISVTSSMASLMDDQEEKSKKSKKKKKKKKKHQETEVFMGSSGQYHGTQ